MKKYLPKIIKKHPIVFWLTIICISSGFMLLITSQPVIISKMLTNINTNLVTILYSINDFIYQHMTTTDIMGSMLATMILAETIKKTFMSKN